MRLKEGLVEPDDPYDAYKFHRNKLALTPVVMFGFYKFVAHFGLPFDADPTSGYVIMAVAGMVEFIKMNGIVKKLSGGGAPPME